MRLAAVQSRRLMPQRSLHVSVQKTHSPGARSQFQLDVTFTVPPGVTILLGHSGAGKTTLLRSIAGLCNPGKGRIVSGERVLFDSEEKIAIEPAKRHVGFVLQDLALFPHLTVEENVCYGLRKLNAKERDHKVATILESFQIADLRKRMPRETSGGEQQRVALARSLVTEPSVLLLDEPLSSLDPRTKAEIIDDLRTWNEDHRIPILYVTHNHEEVFALGERAISLEKGRIQAEGAPIDVVTTPHRQSMAQIAGFENLFEAGVTEILERERTMVCRLTGSFIEIQMPLTRHASSAPLHVGIRADEILLATTPPAILNRCNVIHGRVKQIEVSGQSTEVRIDAGLEFRVKLNERLPKPDLRDGEKVWMIVRPQACHLIRNKRLRACQRLFVFICGHNTSRSPIAQAICNAEIARRLKVSEEALRAHGICVVSAGLTANIGDPISAEAQKALHKLSVPIPVHRSQKLTAELAAGAELIFCMTEAQRKTAITLFPEASSKTYCVQAGLDLEDPHDKDEESFVRFAKHVQQIMPQLVDDFFAPAGISESA